MYRQSVNPFLEKFPNCPVFIRCSRAVALGASVAHDTSPTTICSMPSANFPRWLGVDRDDVFLAHGHTFYDSLIGTCEPRASPETWRR